VLDGFFAADRELLRITGWCQMSPVSERLPLSPTSGCGPASSDAAATAAGTIADRATGGVAIDAAHGWAVCCLRPRRWRFPIR